MAALFGFKWIKEDDYEKSKRFRAGSGLYDGHGTWGEGSTRDEYLTECRESPKYKSSVWYVYERKQELVASRSSR